MALFLHVLSPQNDVALVRPMTPKHFRILWCVKAQESSTHDRDRFAWARSGLRGNPRNEKHPGHGPWPGCFSFLGLPRKPDLAKEIGKYVKDLEEKQIVVFFCQYSAHRAPTAAGCMCSNTLSVHIYICIC